MAGFAAKCGLIWLADCLWGSEWRLTSGLKTGSLQVCPTLSQDRAATRERLVRTVRETGSSLEHSSRLLGAVSTLRLRCLRFPPN